MAPEEKNALKARLLASVSRMFDSFTEDELKKLDAPINADWLVTEVERACCKVVGRNTIAKSGIRG